MSEIVRIVTESKAIVHREIYSGAPILVGGGGGAGSSGYASNVALGTPIPGLPGVSDVKAALEELAKDIPVQTTFTQSALSVAGVFPYMHSRYTTTPSVEVWNEYGAKVYPDDIIIVNPNEIGVLLKSFEPIPGSWRVKVSRG
jgi:D-arabinose 1-dehydrogenase-like Zn-dependent alcohol dehydrogenase